MPSGPRTRQSRSLSRTEPARRRGPRRGAQAGNMRTDRTAGTTTPPRGARVNPAGLLRVAALALIWGSGFLLIKISLRGFTPVQLTFVRLALGAVVLVLILAAVRLRLPGGRRLWLHLVVAALLGNAIPDTLFGIAARTVDSNLAGAINATTPLWTLLFAVALRQSGRPGGLQLLGVV